MGISIVDVFAQPRPTSGPMIGDVTAVLSIGRRKLNEEMDIKTAISGRAFMGVSYDNDVLAYNITGLPPCTNNCNISIAFSNSQECTKKTYDDSSFVTLLDDLTYTTDEEGNTGVKRQSFNVDIENPTDGIENSTQAQEMNLSTFFYDEEGELVACSFLQPTTSDEMKDLANNMLGLVGSMIGDAENDTTAPVAATDGGSSAGGTSLLSFLAIGLSAAVCVLFNV